ncbi:MAG: class I SAM-dependent methyltransferase [Acidimicrobiia bacterium]|nr:class I SAM-dependent methyltransferase [Acidimicrobiia bacterium]
MSCWSCGRATTPFYELKGVPTGSCVLLDTRAAAAGYQTGELALSHCRACGLVQNDAFDESLVDYGSGYEASQAFSPTFIAFAERLADGLIERYGLRGATVFEPGCGDGDFLALMVDRTDGTGLGFDPAHVPGRVPPDLAGRVEIRPERFTPHSSVQADLIVCRHTLEHINDLASFMTATAETARRTQGAVVMFEVPEARRIFETGAFWDVYYEHATYFSPVSVENLFRRHGLSPRRIELEFDDQYIIVEAQVGGEGQVDVRSDPRIEAAVSTFSYRAARQIEHWRDVIASARRPVVWGASSKAVGFMAAVEGVTHAVDINPHKQGSFLAGSAVPVVGPDDLLAIAPDLVVVMNPIYAVEISERLAGRSLSPEVAALG